MDENILVLIYFFGTITIFWMIAKRVRRHRNVMNSSGIINSREQFSEKYPAEIFNFMYNLKLLLKPELDKKDVGELEIIREKLKNISDDVSVYVNNHFHKKVDCSQDKIVIIRNIAICFRSFLIKAQEWKTDQNQPIKFNYCIFRKGLRGLIRSINKHIQGKYKLNKFRRSFKINKERIYFSLFGNLNYSDTETIKFEQEFFINARNIDPNNPATVSQYLSNLQNSWIDNAVRLWEIKDDLIIPLFTVRNILKYCLQHIDSKDAITWINKMKEMLAKHSLDEIIFTGLTYNKGAVDPIGLEEHIIENINEDIFNYIKRYFQLTNQTAGNYAQ